MACKLCKGDGSYTGISGKRNFCSCKTGRRMVSDQLFAPDRIAQMNRPEQIAWLIRRNLESYATKHGYKQNLRHLCGLASVALMIALRREGFPVYIADGRVDFTYHVWTVHNRKIIDLTFTQFEPTAPRVLITKIRNGRHQQESTYRKPQPLATTMTAITWARCVAKIADI
jgi:hypothetical protein